MQEPRHDPDRFIGFQIVGLPDAAVCAIPKNFQDFVPAWMTCYLEHIIGSVFEPSHLLPCFLLGRHKV